MEAAEGFTAEVGMFEGMNMSNVDAGSWDESVELVGSIGGRTKELCKIQVGEVMWS